MVPFLSLVRATFRLGDRLVFENTNWEFHRNQHWAVLGANGSGKSLFADCIRGQIPLVGGELNYHFPLHNDLSDEEAIAFVSFDERRKGIHGMVAQSRWNSVEEEGALSVAEYLSYERVMEINPFEVRKSDGARGKQFQARRQEATQWLEIETLLERALINLSNGERQRVELARALCRPASLLILDEPFAGLDVGTRDHLRSVLQRLMRTQLRLLVITTRPQDLPPGITDLMQIENCSVKRTTRVWARGGVSEGHGLRGSAKVSGLALSAEKLQPRTLASGSFPARQPPSPKGSTAETPPLIELRNATVKYGAKIVLRNLSWAIGNGESWALLGPNGSGKTTLLSLITGDNPQAYANDVRVFGRRRGTGESIWELKHQIGWVSPEMHLHFDLQLTCLAAVESGFFETNGLFETPSRAQRLASRSCLQHLGLGDWAEHPLCELSTGLQRMVLLGRALVKRPHLLVLDEPCQGLDSEHRQFLIHRVDRLIRNGKVTVLYVTHRQDELPRSIKRILRLPGGRVLQRR